MASAGLSVSKAIGHHGHWGYSASFDMVEAIENNDGSVLANDFHAAGSTEPIRILLIQPGDIRHIVIVDTNADSYANQPLNAVPIKPWQGDLDDTALLDLVPFLEAIFKEDIQDVRDVRPRADPVPPACYAWLELRGGSGRPCHRALRAQGSSGPATLRGGECPR